MAVPMAFGTTSHSRDHFEVKDGIISKSISAPLFEALLELEAAFYRNHSESETQEIAQTNEVISSLNQCPLAVADYPKRGTTRVL